MSSVEKPSDTLFDKLHRGGSFLGESDWLTIDEAMNQTFAMVTRDPEPMRIDGRPYAHGFLTLSLLSDLFVSALALEESGKALDVGYVLNYGFNRVRLVEPVPLGGRVRGRFQTAEAGPTERGAITIFPIDISIEIEGAERPALVGEWLLAWRK